MKQPAMPVGRHHPKSFFHVVPSANRIEWLGFAGPINW
jgi:hypothetical protein